MKNIIEKAAKMLGISVKEVKERVLGNIDSIGLKSILKLCGGEEQAFDVSDKKIALELFETGEKFSLKQLEEHGVRHPKQTICNLRKARITVLSEWKDGGPRTGGYKVFWMERA